MANQESQHDQEKKDNENGENFLTEVATIGFFGGFIWSIVNFVAYYLNLSKVGPALILNPWALGDWKNKVLGQLIGILVIAVLSIGIAFIYRAILAKVKSVLAGLLFGAAIWGIVFYLLKPIFPDLKPLHELGWNTITTTLCIYLLYGLFIGYSISFVYDQNYNTPNKS